jgi:DNA-binding transcriptional LysR family regulator
MAETDALSGIAVFVTAARAGNFTLAAEQLGITKSAVGKSIVRLEERLGVKLFNRTTRRTTLTSDGEAYFVACSAAFDEIAATEAALTSRNQVIGGRLRLDMPVAFGRRILLPILLEIAKPHPRLSLTLSFTDAVIDPLHDEVDLVIRFGSLPDTHGLVARKLTSQRLMICASPSYLGEHGCPRSIDDLADHWNIVGMRRGPPVSWLVQEDGITKRVAPRPTHQMSDGGAIIEAAVAGFGICQMPSSVVREHLEAGTLVSIMEDHSQASVDVHAVWARQGQLSPKVRYVVDRLTEYAGKGRLG